MNYTKVLKKCELATLKQEAINFLKPLFENRRKIVIIVMKTSASGMSRQMKVLCSDFDITGYIANLLGEKRNKNYNIIVKGCGMDMTFWLADRITKELYKNDYPSWLSGDGGSCIEWSAIY